MMYVSKPDPSYAWRRVDAPPPAGPDAAAELRMVSQTWRGIEWKHRLCIVRPAGVGKNSQAILLIGGGSWHEGRDSAKFREPPRELRYAHALASATNLPVAVVFQVPFQPMFDGLYEDALISRTFSEFLKSGEADWPLVLPMTKVAVRAMDTVQAFARSQWALDVTGFVVAGASKRGWTTWLTGAIDHRVTGIVPMAFDLLRIYAQLRYQVQTWGHLSERLGDYTKAGLAEQLDTEMGKRLIAIIDPYVHRKRMTAPKLILLGTNDTYWPLDALNLYYDDLEGEKHVLYVPNAGHGLDDFTRVIDTMAAFALRLAGRLTFPSLTWEYQETEAGIMLVLHSDVEPARVSAWVSRAPTRDFRAASWAMQATHRDGCRYVCTLPRPREGCAAIFGEAVYKIDGRPLFLSTNVRIAGGK